VTTKSALSWGLAAGLLLPLAGCQSDAQAWGEANSIIVVAVDSLWDQVEDTVMSALEPTVLAVRNEHTFNVTQVSPLDTDWVQLRRFRQVLSLGVAGDSWVAPAVSEQNRPTPYIAGKRNVWANDQQVTAVVLSPQHPAADVSSMLPSLHTRLDSAYRVYAAGRMYQSKPNPELQDSLAATAGFSLLLPSLYRLEQQDSLYVFRSQTEVGGELWRTLAVTWRTGVDTTTSNETLLAWRDSVVASYTRAQTVAPEPQQRRLIRAGDLTEFEVQGAWSENYEGVPMGGPFVSRMVPCPSLDRTYLIDAWLYAPGRQKYEYMIQLETLLNTFRCGSQAPSPGQ